MLFIEMLYRCIHDDLPLVHQFNPIQVFCDEIHIVLNHQNGFTLLMEREYHPYQFQIIAREISSRNGIKLCEGLIMG